jgi:hypothetical protein
MLVSGSTNSSCFVRPKGPLLRPDLSPGLTAAAGWGKDRRRRPASAGAQRAVCRTCPTVWGCKSPVQPDGGEALAKRKGRTARDCLKEGLFTLGLLSSWLSAICGFFTLARRSDRDYANGEATRINLYQSYYPSQDQKQAGEQKAEIDRLYTEIQLNTRAFVNSRRIAILLCFLSLVAFIAGAGAGGWTVRHPPAVDATIGPEPHSVSP